MSLIAASLLMLAAETGQRTIDYWMVDDGRDIDRESIVFVEKSALFQRPDGWINFSFHEVRNGSRLKTFKSRVLGTWVNCKTREYINDYRTEYDRDGAMLQQGKLDEQRRIPAPGSSEAKVLAFACGDTRGAVQMPRGKNLIVAANEYYALGHPQAASAPPARAPAAAPAPPARAPAAAARKPADYWLVYPNLDDQITGIVDGNDNVRGIVLVVERSTIQSRPDGWTLFDYVDVRNGSEAKDFKWRRFSTRMNCKTRQFADERIQIHKSDGTPPAAFKVSMAPQAVEAGSFNDILLTFVCGTNTAGATQLARDADPVAFADDFYADDTPETLPATASAPASPPAAATAAPQRAGGTASARSAKPELWFVSATADDRALFFVDKASILRKPGDKAEFWQEAVGNLSGGSTVQRQRMEIDCAHRTMRGLEAFAHDFDGKLMGAIKPQPEGGIAERSVAASFFAFVCQGKEDFADKLDPDVSTITYLSMYRELSDLRKTAPNSQRN